MSELTPLGDDAAEAIVRILLEHEVEFLLIGGFAVQLHDVVGMPRTSDIDVTPERSRENLQRLVRALVALDAQLRGVGLPEEGLPVPWHVDLLERMALAMNLITRFGPLDLCLHPSGTDGYADLVRMAEDRALGDVVVRVASLEDIIRSKKAAGRPKDNVAVPILLRHLQGP